MRFLVVDRSETMRRILVNSLRRIGFADVVEATNPSDGLAAIDHGCGFVITNCIAPDAGGETFVDAVRKRPGGEHVPVLMVTTRKNRNVADAGQDAGSTGAIVKPFTPRLLQEKIEQLLAVRNLS